jgi:hypothetical protein
MISALCVYVKGKCVWYGGRYCTIHRTKTFELNFKLGNKKPKGRVI